MTDSVNHPAHYNGHPSGVECIDIIEYMPANVANAFKYIWRCDYKHASPDEDLRKALWYLQREIQRPDKVMVMVSVGVAFREAMIERRIDRDAVCGPAFPSRLGWALRRMWDYASRNQSDLTFAVEIITEELADRSEAAKA